MTPDEEEAMIDELGYPARVAFVAFCADRCLAEARRHPRARAELEQLPLLSRGVDLLWSVAEGGSAPDDAQLRAINEHVRTYELPHPSGEGIRYAHDISLVYAARVLMIGMRVLADPDEADSETVADAMDGPGRLIGTIYDRAAASRDLEEAVLHTALERLHAAQGQPIVRTMLDDIPDWPRGPLTQRYAEGRHNDSLPDEQE